MSIQEPAIHRDTPEPKSSSSTVRKQGDEDYNPFDAENDEHENDKSKDAKCSKQESNRINNG